MGSPLAAGGKTSAGETWALASTSEGPESEAIESERGEKAVFPDGDYERRRPDVEEISFIKDAIEGGRRLPTTALEVDETEKHISRKKEGKPRSVKP